MADFLFDDFFCTLDDTDPGELVQVPLRGTVVPMYFKKGLSLSDRDAAKSQAMTTRIKPNGQVEITRMDETIFAVELLVRAIKSWPFLYKDGTQVPVTRENIQAMFADNADTLAKLAIDRVQSKQAAMQDFTTPSEQSSSAA